MDPYEKCGQFEAMLRALHHMRAFYTWIMMTMGVTMGVSVIFCTSGFEWLVLVSGLLMSLAAIGWSDCNRRIHTVLVVLSAHHEDSN